MFADTNFTSPRRDTPQNTLIENQTKKTSIRATRFSYQKSPAEARLIARDTSRTRVQRKRRAARRTDSE